MAAGFGPIAGLKVGHAQDLRALTGCTVLLLDSAGAPESAKAGMVAACEIRGGAAGARELEALRPGHLVERIHALVFAGGSAFGLEAAAGVVRGVRRARDRLRHRCMARYLLPAGAGATPTRSNHIG